MKRKATRTGTGTGTRTGRPWVVVRTYSAGAFAGQLVSRQGAQEVRLANARRLWYWAGAASLSELASRGVSRPNECKFPAPVTITLTQAIEIIEMSPGAVESVRAVPIWTA